METGATFGVDFSVRDRCVPTAVFAFSLDGPLHAAVHENGIFAEVSIDGKKPDIYRGRIGGQVRDAYLSLLLENFEEQDIEHLMSGAAAKINLYAQGNMMPPFELPLRGSAKAISHAKQLCQDSEIPGQ